MNTTANTTEHCYTLASGAGSDTRHIVQVTGTYYGAYAAAAVCGTSPRIKWADTRWYTITDTTFATPAAAVADTPAMLCKRCAAAAVRMTENTTPAPAESLEENTMENTPATEDAAYARPLEFQAKWEYVEAHGLQTVTPRPGYVVTLEDKVTGQHWSGDSLQGAIDTHKAATATPAATIHPRAVELALMSAPGSTRVDLDPATAPAATYDTACAVVTAYFQGGPGRGECVDAVILTVTGGASHPERNFAALDALELLQARVPGNITAGQYQTLVDPDSYAGTIFIYGTWTD